MKEKFKDESDVVVFGTSLKVLCLAMAWKSLIQIVLFGYVLAIIPIAVVILGFVTLSL